jgi:hypothetical protein
MHGRRIILLSLPKLVRVAERNSETRTPFAHKARRIFAHGSS